MLVSSRFRTAFIEEFIQSLYSEIFFQVSIEQKRQKACVEWLATSYGGKSDSQQ